MLCHFNIFLSLLRHVPYFNFLLAQGSFEIGASVYPVAIKYDPRFGDAFWNSSRQSYMEYVIMMMTSWAIVVDVWYLPPMQIMVGLAYHRLEINTFQLNSAFSSH